MPFTPAHPAIVLPLLRSRYFSATALIIGTTSPDFEYFFKASVSGVHGHTFAGIFYFDLPVTIFLSLLFHQVIKHNLVANLPYFLQKRAIPMLQLDYASRIKKNLLSVVISTILGTFLHIFWDSFTHNGGFFVERVAFYKTVNVPFQGVNYPLFYALQHASTFAGLAIISVYVYFMPVDQNVALSRPKILYWILLVLISSILFALRFLWLPMDFNLGNAVVTTLTAAMISLCFLGLFSNLKSLPNIES